MRVPRHRAELNDYLELLDARFEEAQSSGDRVSHYQRAWASLDADELVFIDEELEHCINDRLYYLENYHCIRDEQGVIKTLYPLQDQQTYVHEILERKWKEDGCFRGIILKPRQCGGTTYSAGIIFHRTIFEPQVFSLSMGHEEGSSAEIYRRMWDAYNLLPWWMRPELASKQQERHLVFQRLDEKRRVVDPGLGSTLIISNAQKAAGVAIGRTIRCAHLSEVSRYPDATVFTADIKPSMNARDILAIMESTAFGRNGLFWNMWKAAEEGKSNWTPIFIPVYRVRKYSIPLAKDEKFKLTEDEKEIRENIKIAENFTVPLPFFKWRRNDINETINATGSDETHYEAYPMNSKEAFIASGLCAFPKKCLDEQTREFIRDPLQIGEIHFTSLETPPILELRSPKSGETKAKPEHFNRLWVWEEPEANDYTEYYIGCDVSSGEADDFSDATVYRIGYHGEPDVQVAEWHGLINASHLARVLAALGVWYNMAEIAVEYTGWGITTGNDLFQVIDYPNVYRWKHLDKVAQTSTLYVHWMTTSKTRPEAINRMGEALLDKTVVLRNAHLIEEMRDFGRFEDQVKIAGIDNNDDMVLANIIALTALRQKSRMGGWDGDSLSQKVAPKVPSIFGVYDEFRRQIPNAQFQTEKEALDYIAKFELKYKTKMMWQVLAIPVMQANTCYSPIHEGTGAENDLHTKYGVPDKHIWPDMVGAYRKQLMNDFYAGNEED